jgi:protein-disulfide isomerase
LDRLLSLSLATAALVLSAAVVKRVFIDDVVVPPPTTQRLLTVEQDDWNAALEHSIAWSPRGARSELVVLFDVECPYCRAFHEGLKALKSEYHERLSVSLLHFPLGMHASARVGARVLECGGAAAQQVHLLDSIYASQDSLAKVNWGVLAARAGIDTSSGFAACIESPASGVRVDSGVAIGRRIGATGTPTVLFNGHRLALPPSVEELRAIIDSALDR